MSIHAGTRLDSKQAARTVIFHRRLLICCLSLAVASLAVWIASLATEHWSVTSCPEGVYVTETGVPGLPEGYLTSAHQGLWRSCKTLFSNATSRPGEADVVTACRNHEVLQTGDLPVDHPYNIVAGYRTMCLAFSVVSILLLLLSIFFSIYTIRLPRYTFKRVTACLYLITGGVMMAMIEVQDSALEYQHQELPSALPSGCFWNYSLSFILAWVSFSTLLFCGCAFFFTSSKKKKRVHGNDQEEFLNEIDEPQFVGR